MKNNLLNKYLLPPYIAAALFVGTTGAAAILAKNNVKMAKENPEKQHIVESCETNLFLCMVIMMISFIMAVLSGVRYPMKVRKKAQEITKHYLQDIFSRRPDIRKYRFILEDSKKLQEIAAIACNGLSKDEQKNIFNFINRELRHINSKNQTTKLQNIENLIINTIQNHAFKNPEYMEQILLAIKNSQKPNIAETAQKVR